MPQIEATPGTGNFVTKNTTQTITADKTFTITSGGATPITAVVDSSTATQPAIIAKDNTNFAQAGNILKVQMVNSSDTGDVVKIENSGTGKSILGTDGSTTKFTVDKNGNAALSSETGVSYMSQSATTSSLVLPASTNYLVDEVLEIGSTVSLEIPTTSRLEVKGRTINGSQLSPNAITIGYTTITSLGGGGTFTTGETTIFTLPVVVPPGGRDIEIMVIVPQLFSSVALDRTDTKIKEGSTILQQFYTSLPVQGVAGTFTAHLVAPTAGAHTYTVTCARDVGTGNITWYADAVGAHSDMIVKLA